MYANNSPSSLATPEQLQALLDVDPPSDLWTRIQSRIPAPELIEKTYFVACRYAVRRLGKSATPHFNDLRALAEHESLQALKKHVDRWRNEVDVQPKLKGLGDGRKGRLPKPKSNSAWIADAEAAHEAFCVYAHIPVTLLTAHLSAEQMYADPALRDYVVRRVQAECRKRTNGKSYRLVDEVYIGEP